MLIQESLFEGANKVEKAIDALKTFEPPEGYYVAFSGGKDSVVIKALCDMAGVKYDAHYRITSVDPPELVRFIKEQHPDVSMDYPRYSDGTVATMWNLIPKKRMPPTRLVRYCCDVLKESGGEGREIPKRSLDKKLDELKASGKTYAEAQRAETIERWARVEIPAGMEVPNPFEEPAKPAEDRPATEPERRNRMSKHINATLHEGGVLILPSCFEFCGLVPQDAELYVEADMAKEENQ